MNSKQHGSLGDPICMRDDAQRRSRGPRDARCSRLGVVRRVKRLAQGGTGAPNKPGFGLLGWVSPGNACRKEASPSGAAQTPEVLVA